MNERLLIVGAGYTGLRVAELAAGRWDEVVATTRSPDRHAALQHTGARVRTWSSDDGVAALPVDAHTTVIYSIPPPETRFVASVLDVAERAGRFVYLSSTAVYGDHDGGLVDEDSERTPTSPVGRRRKEIEDALLRGTLDALIVRIVGIYGPGRTLDRYLAGGRYKLVDGGRKLTNRIHVDDLARIVLAAAERAPRGPRAYIAADGHPVRVCDLVDWLVEHRGIARPAEVTLDDYRAERGDDAAERWANSYTASNRRIIEELGVELQYPDVFSGYRAIFG